MLSPSNLALILGFVINLRCEYLLQVNSYQTWKMPPCEASKSLTPQTQMHKRSALFFHYSTSVLNLHSAGVAGNSSLAFRKPPSPGISLTFWEEGRAFMVARHCWGHLPFTYTVSRDILDGCLRDSFNPSCSLHYLCSWGLGNCFSSGAMLGHQSLSDAIHDPICLALRYGQFLWLGKGLLLPWASTQDIGTDCPDLSIFEFLGGWPNP